MGKSEKEEIRLERVHAPKNIPRTFRGTVYLGFPFIPFRKKDLKTFHKLK
jgi:hypothetical protein